MKKIAAYALAIAFFGAIVGLIYWGIGSLASWVLAYFGVVVPWTICAAAFFLLSCIFGRGYRSAK